MHHKQEHVMMDQHHEVMDMQVVLKIIDHVVYVERQSHMDDREHVMQVINQHDHVVHRQGHVMMDQHHEVTDIRVVEHDVSVMQSDGLKIEIQLQRIVQLYRQIVVE